MSSVSKTIFPLEILEILVENASIDTSRSLALTCKALLPCSRANIHSHYTLNPDGFTHLHALLRTAPHLVPFIHNISLLDLHSYARLPASTISIVVQVLHQLQHLRTISLIQSSKFLGCSWVDVPGAIQEVLFQIFHLETLCGVDAQFFEVCCPVIERCPKIMHLDLYSPCETFTKSSPSVSTLTLKSLRLCMDGTEDGTGIDGILGHGGDPLFDFSKLERLTVDAHRSKYDGQSIFPSGDYVSQIAALSSSSLTELYWEVSSSDLQSLDINVSLEMLPQLRTLVIICNVLERPFTNEFCYAWFSSLMSTRNSRRPILSTTFSGPWSSDPPALRYLITCIEGAQNFVFCFPTSRADWKTGMGRETLKILRGTACKREDVLVKILEPGTFDPTADLRSSRPFTRFSFRQEGIVNRPPHGISRDTD
ncbi:hypothetical protein DL96DRAFT_1813023 [Flagelloscypha sp. PMI_526]|nr:hypothetical protein DL96DRAFT_1813023 [Flagelloscypha sp. PMI_526]